MKLFLIAIESQQIDEGNMAGMIAPACPSYCLLIQPAKPPVCDPPAD